MDYNFIIFVRQIVERASKEIVELSHKQPLGHEIGTIGASGDSTKVGDKLVEEVVIEMMSEYVKKIHMKKIVLISEESGIIEIGNADLDEGYFIILDPIDGSNNMRPWRTPSPFIAISLAVGNLKNLKNRDNFDSIEAGFVGDIFNGHLFYAIRGQGSFVDGFGKIESSPETDIKKSIIGADFDLQDDEFDDLALRMRKILLNKKCQRRLGSSILDFMKVSCGEYDSFFSLGGRMKFYDLAAAKLIIEESGGVFDLIDSKIDYCIIKEIIKTRKNNLLKDVRFKVVVSGNKIIHEKLIGDLC